MKVASSASTILDFGCGIGRYTVPILGHTKANIVAYDLSHTSLNQLDSNCKSHPRRCHLKILKGPAEGFQEHGPYDLILCLFGVLSHIAGQDERQKTLRTLRTALR